MGRAGTSPSPGALSREGKLEAAGTSWSRNLPPAALGAAEVVEGVAGGRDASEPWSSLGVGVSKGQGEEIFRASQAPSVPGDAHAPARPGGGGEGGEAKLLLGLHHGGLLQGGQVRT